MQQATFRSERATYLTFSPREVFAVRNFRFPLFFVRINFAAAAHYRITTAEFVSMHRTEMQVTRAAHSIFNVALSLSLAVHSSYKHVRRRRVNYERNVTGFGILPSRFPPRYIFRLSRPLFRSVNASVL